MQPLPRLYQIATRSSPRVRRREADAFALKPGHYHDVPEGAWQHFQAGRQATGRDRERAELFVIVGLVWTGRYERDLPVYELDWTDTHDPQSFWCEIKYARGESDEL